VAFTYLALIVFLPIVYGRRTGWLPFLPSWLRDDTPSEVDEEELTTLGTITPAETTRGGLPDHVRDDAERDAHVTNPKEK
jgi:hypothetical protein